MLKTMGFPSRYIQGPGALAQADSLPKELRHNRLALLCEKTVREVALLGLLDSFNTAGHASDVVQFFGEINLETIADCKHKIADHQPDVVIGLCGKKPRPSTKRSGIYQAGTNRKSRCPNGWLPASRC